MSGDVQPRKRKDKKRKRDSLDRRSEGDFVFTRKQSLQEDEPREQHQGVHGSKMGNEDVHLHVQGDHETGGHWCAKIFFFSLLAILLGLIGLIILENRGLADLDTPLSESRFSNYFDGWVDEHREAHDEHDAVSASIEEHEHGDEPFEEEEDHSEIDEAEDDDDEKDHDEEDEEEEEDEEDTKENEEENDNETEEVEAETAEEADDETQEEEEENDDENTVEDSAEETKEDEEEETDNKNANDDDNEDEDTQENDDNRDDEDEEDEDTTEDVEPIQTRSHQSSHQASSAQSKTKEEDDDDEPFEEEDDDGTFESLESVVVDNDAEELLLLQEKARQQQASAKKGEPEPEEEPSSYSSPLAVKIGVGVALALVARLVLIRKNPNTNVNEEDEAMNLEQSGEEEYIEEEIEEEEEIEVTDEEFEEEKIEQPKYKPETFEQLNAMYRRPTDFQTSNVEQENTRKVSPPKVPMDEPKTTTKVQDYSQRIEQQPVAASKPSQSRFAQYHREKTPPPEVPIKLAQLSSSTIRPDENVESKESRAYAAEHEEDIEYDDEELYDDEMLEEEEEEEIGDDEEDEEDLSDVDDSELMNRLEAKYGRLPAKEFESDEDVEDQSWTKIKPRGGGPQAMDDDEFEEELKKANEEMLRENLNSALNLFESLSHKFPDKPEAFLGKAKILDKQSEIHRSNSKLGEALDAYKRYLAFGEDILNDTEFSEVAQRCVDRMRFMGVNLQAVPIHEMLIERFPNKVSHRNQLAVTYLMVNRLSEAKHVLEDILARWPNDGFAMVHYGFVLKMLNQNLHLAVEYLRRGIDSQSQGTQDGRFYFNLGDSLQRLGRLEEAREIYRRGAALKLFLSEYQRSLYNVDTLKAQPFWSKRETGYEEFLNRIEENWKVIRDEGLKALNAKGTFQNEAENLRDSGNWQQFELFARGQRRLQNCLAAPVTCGIIEMFPAARFCKRGQVKFSVMHPGTHVWPHCGPTNCRLRAHLGLKVPSGTLLRVGENNRTWEEGKFLIFDDSFEHEVWHNGTSPRLVLIVDIWHPDLTKEQRQSLSPI
ncbi:aspartyl/asparaginyl beta-hydroxylase isoform X3 [Episyrphus balteatus]|uniref:aspartyl/asparaginyl beta-hydroxylase isoform X3 n=1 Tax=Episyrphus balteatus TaxID=286459 RepID=UPI002486C807|nr:aspartyl/asparaginyl beta-hydroxylase isoform X3 [Episyrphus balteatus]